MRTGKDEYDLHHFDETNIVAGDSLNTAQFLDDNAVNLIQFDIVVSNPPFSMGNWWRNGSEYNRFNWGMPPDLKVTMPLFCTY